MKVIPKGFDPVDLNYLDFELRIEQQESGYRARVSRSPIDEQASITFGLPFETSAVTKIGAATGAKRHLVPVTSAEERVHSPKELGRLLFETIFRDDVLVCLRSSLTVAESQNQGRLRIRLNLSDTPDLIDLPWEYLFDPKTNRFLCLSMDTPLVRYLDVPGQIQPLTVKPPLRVLVVIASPTDYPSLNVELEWTQIQHALNDLVRHKLVTLERLPLSTLAALHDQLRQDDYQILHFIGHSSFDDDSGKGIIVFEDENKHSQLAKAEHLGTILHDAKSLRLVILNACSSARTSHGEPFTGIGQLLLQQGIPAVIAMQFDISDQAAVTLAYTFYKALASRYPVDAALAEARKAIAIQNEEIEWGTPVLYIRAANGQLFAFDRRHIPVRTIIAILGIVLCGLVGITIVQQNYCRAQLIDLMMRRRLPTVHSYIERARAYRDEGYLVCARRDFESGFSIAKNESDQDRLYYGLATVALADLNLTPELLEKAHAWSQEGLQGEVTEPFLYLSDGFALCQLQRANEAAEQIETFIQNHVASTEIKSIYKDLQVGIDSSFDCRMAALDLP